MGVFLNVFQDADHAAVEDVTFDVVYANGDLIGTQVLGDHAKIEDVRLGVVYDGGLLIGTMDLPSQDDVREGVVFDNSLQTGNMHLPLITQVLLGVGYGTDATELVGTLDCGAPPVTLSGYNPYG